MTNNLKRIIALFVLVPLFGIAASIKANAAVYQVPSEQEAITFVKDLVQKGMDVANKEGSPREEFARLLQDNFVTEEISKTVLGPVGRSMTPQQKERFHELYKKRLIQIYSDPEKVKTFRAKVQEVSPKAVKQTDGTVLVKSTFKDKNNPGAEHAKVDWKVVKKNDKLYILDVMFEGISKLITERKEYGELFNTKGQGNPDKFLDYLQSILGA